MQRLVFCVLNPLQVSNTSRPFMCLRQFSKVPGTVDSGVAQNEKRKETDSLPGMSA